MDFSWRQGSSFVESDQFGGFKGDSVEGIVDEGVHDAHWFFGDSDVGVDLFQDFVDVDREGFDSSFFVFSVCLGGGFDSLLGGFCGFFGSRHFEFDGVLVYLLFNYYKKVFV